MPARETLNSIYLIGSLVLAAIVGSVTNSWVAFIVSLAVLVAASLHSGRIRPDRHTRRRR
jgi:hypothetical protein